MVLIFDGNSNSNSICINTKVYKKKTEKFQIDSTIKTMWLGCEMTNVIILNVKFNVDRR